jgi:putative DNA primase/helicase
MSFRDHDRADLLTKQLPYENNPDAPKPLRWIRFIREITMRDDDLAAYIQKAVGYSLSGDVSESYLFFLYGDGQNGKSVFLRTLETIFNEYSARIGADRLTVGGKGGGIPNDLAHLKEARLAVGTEIEQGQKLHESKIKDMTGKDKILARHLHKDYFEFMPQFTLWMYGNYRPIVRGNDQGIWRRLKVIPFKAFFDRKDPLFDAHLDDKLMDEAEGIIQWALQGYVKWQEDGHIKPPAVVEDAITEYRKDMDSFQRFQDDILHLGEEAMGGLIKPLEIYGLYEGWCNDMLVNPMPKALFTQRLGAYVGVSLVQLSKNEGEYKRGSRVYRGVRIKKGEEEVRTELT